MTFDGKRLPGSGAENPPRFSAWLHVAGYASVFAAAIAVYWPTLGYELLNWDDQIYVLQNPWIREISIRNLKSLFTQSYSTNFLPLHLLSYMFDYRVWGLNPLGYHLSSVLLHALVSAVFLGVALRITGSFATALLASLFFAVHPSHVEAVAWVSSRKDLLSTLFLLLSVGAYLRAGRGQSTRWGPYVLSVLLFAFGLLSKVTIATLPAFLLLLDWFPDSRDAQAERPTLLWALATKLPFVAVGFLLVAINYQAQVRAAAPYAQDPLQYALVKGHAVWNYIALLVGVRGGIPVYDLPQIGGSPFEIAWNLGGLVVLPAVAIWLWRRRRRGEFLGVSWVVVFALPAVAFPVVTFMADRYMYAPSLGFCWVLAVSIAAAGGLRRTPAWTPRSALAGLAAAIIIAGFAARTVSYAEIWRNSETLWTFAITRSRDYRIFVNLANIRSQQQRWDEAERLLKQATSADAVAPYRSLGVLYNNLGRFDEALAATDRALAIFARKGRDPDTDAELHFNRGMILWSLGRIEQAVREWERTLEEQPANAQAEQWLERARAAASRHPGAPAP